MSLFLASLGFGLVTAAVLAIAAVGFTMQFAVTDVLNLAYGAVMIGSAFVAYWLNQAGVNVWLGLLVAAAAGAVASVLLNRGIYAPFQRRGSAPITLVIVSLGMTLIIEFGLQAIVGGTSVSYTMSQGPTLKAGGLILTTVQLVIIGLFLVVILAAVFLGGPGQAYGAMAGAVIIGIATEISAAYFTPSYKDVIAFLVLLIVMAVRPGGVLGATA